MKRVLAILMVVSFLSVNGLADGGIAIGRDGGIAIGRGGGIAIGIITSVINAVTGGIAIG